VPGVHAGNALIWCREAELRGGGLGAPGKLMIADRAGARDWLVLTRPIGSGVVATAVTHAACGAPL
jgi:selenophosphate synthase